MARRKHAIGEPVQQFDEYIRHAGWIVECSCGWASDRRWLALQARQESEGHPR